jgi:pyruvate/2-oxoglutarate dehydrogenase complex dihydrolipoamide acyltransferase (E2) component
MITKVMMPQVGQDMEIGRIVHWIKKEGDHVKKGDALCEVETEKAVVEVPAPAEGVLIEILHPDNAD